jgi:L-threonylcarbamoyladenylate synthase
MDDPAAQAHTLFAALRTLDDLAVDVILVPLPVADGIGSAMRDRLRKAAMQG